ncbi:MAG: hypothetical protein PSV23_02445 [Brevundimonas sp.]|uniref:hypothetical protein n=1 Tax=Brevundimonas sp. TaxID=1871086 RepID=UPI0024888D00|nr:hypothetical protein [Brevundimonas sp.]MDI1325636.1 hypothetical protein [Brevundimonas sp.]
MIKPLDQMLEADPRYQDLLIEEPAGEWRALSLGDHHAIVAAIVIPASVPDEVATLFRRAQHAFLYAWFDYELAPLAEAQAFAALESALRLRLTMKGADAAL